MPEELMQLWNRVIIVAAPWGQPLAALAIAGFTFLLRGIFTRVIFRIFLRLTGKTKSDLDRAVLLALEAPLKSLILVIGIYIALGYITITPSGVLVLERLFRSGIIVIIAWALCNLVGGRAFDRISEHLQLEEIVAEFAAKVIRFVVIALAISIVAQEWNYDVSGLLAGLGLGGLAFALAAKDAVANMFGGMVIVMDKPFSVGDWILSPSVEGTVEEMTFRSTKVRTFANALVTVPNMVIANEPVTNWSRMEKRRVSFHLGVTYGTPRAKIETCVERIDTLLRGHPEVHPDTILVRFEGFGASSLDIFVYYFTITRVWAEYLRVREEINLKIMEILEEEAVSVAFPSRSLYIEKQPGEATGPPPGGNGPEK